MLHQVGKINFMRKLFLPLLLLSTHFLHAQDTARAEAEISEATVYFGYGAELTHHAKPRLGFGTKIIIIDKISTNVDINSLQVSCPDDVLLLSQRYSIYQAPVIIPKKGREIILLEDSIALIRKNISRIQNNIAIERETLEKTGKLIESTLSGDNKNVNSTEVLKLVEFYNTKIERSKTNIYNYGENVASLTTRIDELNRKIDSLNTKTVDAPKPVGRLILQVISKRSGEAPVSLSYYTTNAGWAPMYDLRVNSKNNKVKLVYKASVTQTTGVDWKKTKLTLSTGTPNFGVEAPILTPWYLQLYVPQLYNRLSAKVSNMATNTIPGFRDKDLGETVVVTADGYAAKKQEYSNINPSTLQTYTTLNEGQLNTNFEIDLPYDIESDGQLHSVNIKDEEVDCRLKNYSVPRMRKEAYLLAEITDWQKLDLLPGEANIIMDETYIGRSVIDPNSTADTMSLSLGKDKRIAVKRELVKSLSSLKSSGGVNKQSFVYEITVKNNKLTDVDLILKDQIPLSSIKEVEVKLDDNGDAEVNTELGILNWQIKLKPGESKKVRFAYSVKYPKDKRISNL